MATNTLASEPSHADKCRAAELKWRGAAPGLPAEMAIKFMSALQAGSTLRYLISGGIQHADTFIVGAARFNKHCELNPDWGAEALRLANANRKVVEKKRSPLARGVMVCKRGHSLAGAPVYMKEGYPYRFCKECRKMREHRGGILRPETEQKIKAALERGASISSITASGGSNYLVTHASFKAYRRLNPDIDALAQSIISTAHVRSQKLRWVRVRNSEIRDSNNDYYKIRGMIPEGNPHRDDIVARMFEDMLSGLLKREEVPRRIRNYVAEFNRLYPAKYAKFGDARLVSLDEVMFDDGTSSRGDYVSRGLWD